jgi:hypothetical protein
MVGTKGGTESRFARYEVLKLIKRKQGGTDTQCQRVIMTMNVEPEASLMPNALFHTKAEAIHPKSTWNGKWAGRKTAGWQT